MDHRKGRSKIAETAIKRVAQPGPPLCAGVARNGVEAPPAVLLFIQILRAQWAEVSCLPVHSQAKLARALASTKY